MTCPACGEYQCPGTCRGLPVEWGCYSAPYVYADSMGPGGATGRRYAQTMNDGGRPLAGTHWHEDMGDCSYLGHGGGLGQLGDELPPGGVEDQPCPPGWPEGIPCVLNPEIPPGTFPTLPGVPLPGTSPTIPGAPAPTVPTVVVTEEEARRREDEAFARGKEAERSSLIMYTGISAVVSGLVGIALGKVFK